MILKAVLGIWVNDSSLKGTYLHPQGVRPTTLLLPSPFWEV